MESINVLHHAMILECESSPHTFAVYPTEAAAVARLEAERRKFDPRCTDPCWLYVLRVENGVVTSRRDLSSENPMQEVHAAM